MQPPPPTGAEDGSRAILSPSSISPPELESLLSTCYLEPANRAAIPIPPWLWGVLRRSQDIASRMGAIAAVLWSLMGASASSGTFRSDLAKAFMGQRNANQPKVSMNLLPHEVRHSSSPMTFSVANDGSVGLVFAAGAVINLMYLISSFGLVSFGFDGYFGEGSASCGAVSATLSHGKARCSLNPSNSVEISEVYAALLQQKIDFFYPELSSEDASYSGVNGRLSWSLFSLPGLHFDAWSSVLWRPISHFLWATLEPLRMSKALTAATHTAAPYGSGCPYSHLDTSALSPSTASWYTPVALWWITVWAVCVVFALLCLYALCRLPFSECGAMRVSDIRRLTEITNKKRGLIDSTVDVVDGDGDVDPSAVDKEQGAPLLNRIKSLSATNDDLARLWWDRTHRDTTDAEAKAAHIAERAQLVLGASSRVVVDEESQPFILSESGESSVRSHSSPSSSVVRHSVVLRVVMAILFAPTAIMLSLVSTVVMPIAITLLFIAPFYLLSFLASMISGGSKQVDGFLETFNFVRPEDNSEKSKDKEKPRLLITPLSVQFCRSCKHHVEGFDHHCGVVGACIGSHNFPLFLMLLYSVAIGITFAGVAFGGTYVVGRPSFYAVSGNDNGQHMAGGIAPPTTNEAMGCAALGNAFPLTAAPLWSRGTREWGAPWPSISESVVIALLRDDDGYKKRLKTARAARGDSSPLKPHVLFFPNQTANDVATASYGSYSEYYRAAYVATAESSGEQGGLVLLLKTCLSAAWLWLRIILFSFAHETAVPAACLFLQLYVGVFAVFLTIHYVLLLYIMRHSVLFRAEEEIMDQIQALPKNCADDTAILGTNVGAAHPLIVAMRAAFDDARAQLAHRMGGVYGPGGSRYSWSDAHKSSDDELIEDAVALKLPEGIVSGSDDEDDGKRNVTRRGKGAQKAAKKGPARKNQITAVFSFALGFFTTLRWFPRYVMAKLASLVSSRVVVPPMPASTREALLFAKALLFYTWWSMNECSLPLVTSERKVI